MALDADPYRTLGLTRGATLVEVKRAYRRLAKVNHPDAAGPGALPRFLAIQAAYEQLAGGAPGSDGGHRGATPSRRRPSDAETDRGAATRRAYGGRPGPAQPGSGPAGPARRESGPPRPGSEPAAGSGRGHGSAAAGGGRTSHGPRQRDPGRSAASRGKATLGSTSYDGADAGPFEPDWGGASWYGTTSGTYWTINPKEYADPRKHGPEYQARARRSSRSGAASPAAAGPATPGQAQDGAPDPRADPRAQPTDPTDPTHTTSSWWDSTSGPADRGSEPGPSADRPHGPVPRAPVRDARSSAAPPFRTDEPAPDPSRAALDLGRALTDPRSGGLRGRALRAFLGWLPLAFGLGWLVGELTGCGRFAATCDPSVGPLTAIGQGTILAALLLVPEVAALTAGAALVLLVAAGAGSLALSAGGAAADEASRQAAMGGLLLVAWLSGLTIALVRRVHSGPRAAGPVS